jgi:hypothetical protein
MARIIALTVIALAAVANSAAACDKCGRHTAVTCCPCCQIECCPCQLHEHAIMVPCRVTETHLRIKIVETLKEREETYTVFEKKPVSRKYSKECCYLEKEVKSKLITIESCRRVELPVTLVDSVNVCVPEMQEGVRRREVCTECGKICIEEPCTCMINRAEKVARVQNGTRQDVVFEETTKTIDYCVISPKYHTIDCGEETTCELVPVTKTRKVQVCVPEAVKVPCDVEVTKMVAKNICCCDVCWCAMQEQAAQDAKHAKHKKDCN